MATWPSKQKSTLPTKRSRSTSAKGTKPAVGVVKPGLGQMEYLDYKPRTFKVAVKKTPASRKKMSVRYVPGVTSTSRRTPASTMSSKLKDSAKKRSIKSSSPLTYIRKRIVSWNLFTGKLSLLNKPIFSLKDITIAILLAYVLYNR